MWTPQLIKMFIKGSVDFWSLFNSGNVFNTKRYKYHTIQRTTHVWLAIRNILHTYIPFTLDPQRGSRYISDIPPRYPHFMKMLYYLAMRHTADVTGGKLIRNRKCLVWCAGQKKRIAPLPFFRGCRKRRLKDYQHSTWDRLRSETY
jgi:hypothetical protein